MGLLGDDDLVDYFLPSYFPCISNTNLIYDLDSKRHYKIKFLDKEKKNNKKEMKGKKEDEVGGGGGRRKRRQR